MRATRLIPRFAPGKGLALEKSESIAKDGRRFMATRHLADSAPASRSP